MLITHGIVAPALQLNLSPLQNLAAMIIRCSEKGRCTAAASQRRVVSRAHFPGGIPPKSRAPSTRHRRRFGPRAPNPWAGQGLAPVARALLDALPASVLFKRMAVPGTLITEQHVPTAANRKMPGGHRRFRRPSRPDLLKWQNRHAAWQTIGALTIPAAQQAPDPSQRRPKSNRAPSPTGGGIQLRNGPASNDSKQTMAQPRS